MHYYLIIALQGFCIYHLYKNRNNYYWVFLIIFLPVIGSIIYIITQVYNKRDAEKITNEISTIINPTKKVKDLEKKLQFSETFQNRVDLADEWFNLKDYRSASEHYLKSLKGNHENDFYVISKLIECLFKLEDFNEVLSYSEKIKNNKEFEKSRTQFIYGLALEKEGRLDEAEINLKTIDIRYSNYDERLVLAKFLLYRNKDEEAKEILNEISTESEYMTKLNRRKYKLTIQEVKKLLSEV